MIVLRSKVPLCNLPVELSMKIFVVDGDVETKKVLNQKSTRKM